MPVYTLSKLAEQDLTDVASYSHERWGIERAIRYVQDLRSLAQRLAESPQMGRTSNRVQRGLRRMECESHVILYRITKDGILVSRILHHRMVPERYKHG